MKLKLAASLATVLVAGGVAFALSESAVIAFLSVLLFAPPQLMLLWLWCPHCKKLAFANRNGIALGGGCPSCGNDF